MHAQTRQLAEQHLELWRDATLSNQERHAHICCRHVLLGNFEAARQYLAAATITDEELAATLREIERDLR